MSNMILLVTNEMGLKEQFCERLKREEYMVETADSAAQAEELLRYKRFYLYIVDVDLPDSTGFRLCKYISRLSKNPIMCISNYKDDSMLVRCLRSGADDCIAKPVSMRVMLEKVRALFRRSVDEEGKASYIYVTGSLAFDIDCREAFYQNRKLKITKGEFNLLSVMVKNAGHVIDRNTMLEAVNGVNKGACEDNTLSVRICRLRDKLKKLDNEKYFSTVRGVGYRWEKPVEKELKRC